MVSSLISPSRLISPSLPSDLSVVAGACRLISLPSDLSVVDARKVVASRAGILRPSRFTEEQVVRMLREADKTSVADVAKMHGVSEQTLYIWRKRYGELDVARTPSVCARWRSPV